MSFTLCHCRNDSSGCDKSAATRPGPASTNICQYPGDTTMPICAGVIRTAEERFVLRTSYSLLRTWRRIRQTSLIRKGRSNCPGTTLRIRHESTTGCSALSAAALQIPRTEWTLSPPPRPRFEKPEVGGCDCCLSRQRRGVLRCRTSARTGRRYEGPHVLEV